jgi:hypothetical protein
MSKELETKFENENMDRCKKGCLKFKTCKVKNKQDIVDCEDFEEVIDFPN